MERKDLAKAFHQTVGFALSKVKEVQIQNELKNKVEGDYFLVSNPFFVSQLADAPKEKIEDFYGTINDPHAAEKFGTKDIKEFSYWAWRSCGIAALQMVLKTELGSRFNRKTMDLVNEALEIDGYDRESDAGWFHRALVRLGKKYGVRGELSKFTPSSQIAVLIDQKNYVLCSVKSEVGGHIVWAYGYKIGKEGKIDGFWINDPSTYHHKGEERYVSKKEFDKIFTRRLIVFRKDNDRDR